ncbi:MAG TPA: phosphodiester glycosidase family protein [Gemmatimonadaceae bacterium]|nr:phosphodiester glycosidase family protein [Gemmatimonadaceae bacterium]
MAWRTRVIVARLDPSRLRFRLDTAFARPLRADWSLARVPGAAAAAFNAGQFLEAMPWGWVVLDGHEFLPPGSGPLATTIAIDSTGAVHWISADSLTRARPSRIAWAFQSYPALLDDGTVPVPLRAADRGVDVAHRDARLALGRLRDGRLLVVLTRFDALGETLGFVPFGLTVPEMAALMGALGCRDAVLLDGGISAQLFVRDAAGIAHAWRGVRKVPLALVAISR